MPSSVRAKQMQVIIVKLITTCTDQMFCCRITVGGIMVGGAGNIRQLPTVAIN